MKIFEHNIKNKIHFVGIGGIGMSGIAELMHDLGYKIQGSDISRSKNIERFNHDDIGWNYRITNLQAALGCGQLKNINWIIRRKKEIK